MTKAQAAYMLLESLAEITEENSLLGGAPETFCYLPFANKLDLDTFYQVEHALIRNKFVKRSAGPVLSITDAGRAVLAEVRDKIAAAKGSTAEKK